VARLVIQRRTVLLGLVILAVIALLAALAPLIAPYAPNRLSVVNRLKPPSGSLLVRHGRVRPRCFQPHDLCRPALAARGRLGRRLRLVVGITLGVSQASSGSSTRRSPASSTP
jgi:peptide/nickel transport system permease protein